ncbi:hydrolase activity protein [[Candida] boidinii]|uniref:Unnamed protein product n=1 Tax=Candida boidinii TaxID=5477 RepID=A0ACB5TLF4_CANBO|nr:hydrolase activity protein [[Candida] boidinii]OWB71289.1 hydrolase activity protein [[Candida] boidinii]GME90906.1 unnamed protein product [[Candida] boidinii]
MSKIQLKDNEEILQIPVLGSKNKEAFVVGILTKPKSSINDNNKKRLVISMHGMAGHKSYLYMPQLSDELSSKLGYYVFRFDFRGCGDSSDHEDPSLGRLISDDIMDLSSVVKYFVDGTYTQNKESNREEDGKGKFIVSCLVAHSRGTLPMFDYALKTSRDDGIVIPFIINCSGRFNGAKLLEYVNKRAPEVVKQGGYNGQGYIKGRYRNIWVPYQESLDLGRQVMTRVKDLDSHCKILSVYGLKDEIIPLEDAAKYANALQERHQLEFIEGADHNYHGIISQDQPDFENEFNYPIHGRKKVIDYNPRVVEIISNWLGSSTKL